MQDSGMSSRLAMYCRVSGGRYLWALRSCTASRMPSNSPGRPLCWAEREPPHHGNAAVVVPRPLFPARVVPREREFVGGVADARIEGCLSLSGRIALMSETGA